MSSLTWLIVIVGVVLNFILLFRAIDKEPQGAMGMLPAFAIAFVPYLFVVFWIGEIIWTKVDEWRS